MIQMRTWLTVADNSGARKLMCIMPVGGDAGLKRAVVDRLIHPRGGCVRTFECDRVRVLDAAVTQGKLTKIEWIAGMEHYMAMPSTLHN